MSTPNAGKPEPTRYLPVPGNPGQGRGPMGQNPVPGPGPRPGGPAGATPPGLSAGPDARALFKAIARRWLLALSLGSVFAMAAAVAAWYLLAPEYTAFAQVRVAQVPDHKVYDGKGSTDSKPEFETYKRFQASEIKSRFVLLAALKKPEVKRLRMVQEQPEPLTWLEEVLKVQVKDGLEIVTFSLAGADPEEVVVLVRAILASYMEGAANKELDARKKRLNDVQGAFNESLDKLAGLRKDLREKTLKAANGADPETLRNKQLILMTNLTEAQRQHHQAQDELRHAQLLLAQHEARKKSLLKLTLPKTILSQAVDADKRSQRILKAIEREEEIIRAYEEVAREDEYSLVQARKMKAKLEKQLQARREGLEKDLKEHYRQQVEDTYENNRSQLKVAIPPLESREKSLGIKVSELAVEAGKHSNFSTSADQSREEIQQVEQLSRDLGKKTSELQTEVNAAPRVTAYQDAGLQKVDTKRRLMGVILAPVAILVLVCFGVGWWEFRARRIQTPEEVVSGLGMRLVGAVPALSGQALDRLAVAGEAQDGLESSLLESIDAIRTLLLRDASVESTRVVMVTSAVAGEGKTILATTLATSLARAGRRTLLIDCDLRTPTAHQLFEQSLQPGLSEVLLNEIDLIDAVRPTTAIDGLWLIPAGQWDREVVQALAREGVGEIFERLKEEFDFIVVDSHPVLPATDSLLIGQHVDAVILSLLKDVSQTPRVHAAAQRLGSLGIRVLGAVVNGMTGEACPSGYQPPVAAVR